MISYRSRGFNDLGFQGPPFFLFFLSIFATQGVARPESLSDRGRRPMKSEKSLNPPSLHCKPYSSYCIL